MQRLLPRLLTMHNGAAIEFLGPFLGLLASVRSPDNLDEQSWGLVLRSPRVGALHP